jgi:hypothetical protein
VVTFLTLACAVCGSNPEQSNEAYLSMTMLMSLTPLFAVFGLGIFIVRRAIAADKKSQVATEKTGASQSASNG